MRIINFLFIVFFPSILCWSCYYDNRESLYPSGAICDTLNITYSGTISGIIDIHCNKCHSTAKAPTLGAGIILDNHTALLVSVKNGSLYNSIAQNGLASEMPKNASKLDACTIQKVRKWIDKGALKN